MKDMQFAERLRSLLAEMITVMDEEAEALIHGGQEAALFKAFAVKKERFLLELHKLSAADVRSSVDEFRDLSVRLAERTQRNAALLEARMQAISKLLACFGRAEEKPVGPFALYRAQE